MANGVRKSRLRREIEQRKRVFSAQEVAGVWTSSPGRMLPLSLYDRTYVGVPLAVWKLALQYSGVNTRRYLPERRDCDDFAFALRGEIPGKLALNGVGVVLDVGLAHAYNALLAIDDSGKPEILFCEPQTDEIDAGLLRRERGGLQRGSCAF